MTNTPDFPALVELASRLEGKDKKTCELALYTLKKQDERLAKKDAIISHLNDKVSMYAVGNMATAKLNASLLDEIAELKEALEGK